METKWGKKKTNKEQKNQNCLKRRRGIKIGRKRKREEGRIEMGRIKKYKKRTSKSIKESMKEEGNVRN